MRVCMMETGGWGGIHHYAHALCCALAKGDAVDLTVLGNQRYELDSASLPFRLERVFRRENYFKSLLRLGQVLRRIRPDILHIQSQLAPRKDLLLFALCRRLGVPVVMTVHNIYPHEARTAEKFMYAAYYRRSAGLILHSHRNTQFLREEVKGIDPKRLHVVPFGNYDQFRDMEVSRDEARRRLGLPQEGRIALFFGMVRPYKGLDLFLAAAEGVRRACPQAFFVVAGQVLHGERSQYEGWVDKCGIDNKGLKVNFGYLSMEEVVTHVCACDVLVLPYRRIYQSGVLFMAYSFGRPVVATRVGSFPESIEEGRSGWLVEPGDVEALTKRLKQVLGQRSLTDSAGAYARNLADSRYHWDGIAAQTTRVYDQVVSGA
jgi:D-inositol-3-phosphate glycosyltransferase